MIKSYVRYKRVFSSDTYPVNKRQCEVLLAEMAGKVLFTGFGASSNVALLECLCYQLTTKEAPILLNLRIFHRKVAFSDHTSCEIVTVTNNLSYEFLQRLKMSVLTLELQMSEYYPSVELAQVS